MNRTGKCIIIIILVVLVAGGFTAANKDKQATDEPIKISFIGPLTGELALYGEVERNVVELAVDEINASGGINGRNIEVLYQDDKCEGKEALSIVRKLIDIDGIDILLVTCSQSILPLAQITEPEEVLILSAYAANSEISDAGEFIFRNTWHNKGYATFAAQTVRDEHSEIAIISEITDFAADFRNIFVAEFTGGGGTIIANESFPAGDKDMRSQILKVLDANPEVIFLNPTGPATGIPLLKQLREFGYSGKVYGSIFAAAPEIHSLLEANGLLYFGDPDVDNVRKKTLFENYKKKYGEYPSLEFPAATRYDTVYILKEAMKNVGTNSVAVRDYLYNMDSFTGVLGTYRFDERGDVVGVEPSVKQIVNGESVSVE